jgi:hypothetical protein
MLPALGGIVGWRLAGFFSRGLRLLLLCGRLCLLFRGDLGLFLDGFDGRAAFKERGRNRWGAQNGRDTGGRCK